MTAYYQNDKTIAFISKYGLFKEDPIQQVQLQHRLNLVDAFEIKEGMRVLEIGCGQGDTTVAIADAVGDTGHVVAIDIASPDYGAPLTLGQSTNLIKNSPLGKRISFHFEMDFEEFQSNTPFDVAVLSHSSWYFRHPEDLLKYFKKFRRITKRVCFAEWDLEFTSINQRSHFCAATILSLYSSFVNNDGNIQNLFDKKQIQHLLEQSGFHIEKQLTVNATYLQDAHWEKDYANSIRHNFDHVPPMIQSLVKSYYHIMNAQNEDVIESLNSFILIAKTNETA